MKLNRMKSAYVAAIGTGVFLLLYLSTPEWRGLELLSQDARCTASAALGLPAASPSGKVVLVGMEEDELLRRKPKIFWYPDIGRFIDVMRKSGAKVIGIDMIPVHSLGEEINTVARQILGIDAGGKVLEALGERTDHSLLGPILLAGGSVRIVQGMAEGSVPYFYPMLPVMPHVEGASVRVLPDIDHVLRRQPLRMEGMNSFPYAVYLGEEGKPLLTEEIILNCRLAEGIPRYSFTEVLEGKIPPEKFAGKSVILGFISRYEDVFPTAIGRIPGALVHAVSVETMLTGTGLREVHPAAGALLLLLLAASGTAFSGGLRPLRAACAVAALTGLLFACSLFLFARGLVIPLFPHAVAPLACFSFIFPCRYLMEERHRKKIYRMFSYYLDNSVIDSLMNKDIESLFKGEYKEVTVLFLDIREFTRFSAMHSAEGVVAFLNAFLGRINDLISARNGMVNKYIGDGLLAFFWGEDSSAAAVQVARDILEEVAAMNDDGTVPPSPGWRLGVGIGIERGRVLMGNIGSIRRMDFTIIGTPVNVASRLESLNKLLNTSVLVGSTAAAAVDDPMLVSVGRHSVRGLREEMEVFTIAAGTHGPSGTCGLEKRGTT